MQRIKISEIFTSLQGEGLYLGQPSVFIRTFGCNFQCRGLGLSDNIKSIEPEIIAKQLYKYETYDSLPLATTGCDSYASWHPSFKHLSPYMTIDEIMDKIYSLLSTAWLEHVIITGGEPLLGWQQIYPKLIDKLIYKGFNTITFETNGTKSLQDGFKEYLSNAPIDIVFSVSPKLPCSGEVITDALKPKVIKEYIKYGHTYLKFVIGSDKDIKDVEQFVKAYKDEGWDGEVFLMPVGGISEVYEITSHKIANIAMKYGYRFTPRLQVDLYKNSWGK